MLEKVLRRKNAGKNSWQEKIVAKKELVARKICRQCSGVCMTVSRLLLLPLTCHAPCVRSAIT
jgi:hypothetical protein